MTVRVRDLLAFKNTCPTTHEQFLNGNFVTQKRSHMFLVLAHDQVHEQLNAMVKENGGVIGITEYETAFKRWMVVDREIAKLLNEYDDKHSVNKYLVFLLFSCQKCHWCGRRTWQPLFSGTSTDFYPLDSVVHTIRTAKDIGKTQYHIEDRFIDNIIAFNDTIHKNSLPVF